MTKGIYLLLGSNLGDKRANLISAQEKINEIIGRVITCSNIYHSEAWGNTHQPSFLNQVILIKSYKTPNELLVLLQKIENEMGRIRIEKWSERLIDIDLLYFSDLIIDQKELKVPHPEIANRRFTLIPLVDLAPKLVHPIHQKTNLELLGICKDSLKVWALKGSETDAI